VQNYGQYCRHVIKAQPSFHDVDTENGESKTYVEYVNKWSHVLYVQTYRLAHCFAADSLKKMVYVVIYERIFQNGSFCELEMSIESHDFVKILLRSNQKSNELSMNRKCEQRVTTNERTFMKV